MRVGNVMTAMGYVCRGKVGRFNQRGFVTVIRKGRIPKVPPNTSEWHKLAGEEIGDHSWAKSI